jgi:hypothetical protein
MTAGAWPDWVTAPVSVRGDGTYMPASLPVSFAKLVIRMR